MSVSVCYTLVLSTPRTFIGALYNFSIKFNISSNVIVLYNGTIMFTVETTMFYVINFVFKFLMLATKFLHKSCPWESGHAWWPFLFRTNNGYKLSVFFSSTQLSEIRYSKVNKNVLLLPRNSNMPNY